MWQDHVAAGGCISWWQHKFFFVEIHLTRHAQAHVIFSQRWYVRTFLPSLGGFFFVKYFSK